MKMIFTAVLGLLILIPMSSFGEPPSKAIPICVARPKETRTHQVHYGEQKTAMSENDADLLAIGDYQTLLENCKARFIVTGKGTLGPIGYLDSKFNDYSTEKIEDPEFEVQ